MDAGTENYFCWGVCYGPQLAGDMPEWNAAAQHAVTLSPNTPVSNFSGYHVPNGIAGTSTYRFVWYDVGNPTDTAWVDIQFRTTGVGIDEANGVVGAFGVYPTPSAGSDLQLQLEVSGAVNELAVSVYNMLGERVETLPVRSNTNRIILPAAQLAPGVYFASVERAGAALTTKRFVVTGR
ncbi:MAG: T9SS type A sorting domain-containing protein [Flavobacteriales bacterium]|nr:T9SS type A sorting domain-containing protein [Flavobacteriales bacterium]